MEAYERPKKGFAAEQVGGVSRLLDKPDDQNHSAFPAQSAGRGLKVGETK
jgi:hypothetical protein